MRALALSGSADCTVPFLSKVIRVRMRGWAPAVSMSNVSAPGLEIPVFPSSTAAPDTTISMLKSYSFMPPDTFPRSFSMAACWWSRGGPVFPGLSCCRQPAIIGWRVSAGQQGEREACSFTGVWGFLPGYFLSGAGEKRRWSCQRIHPARGIEVVNHPETVPDRTFITIDHIAEISQDITGVAGDRIDGNPSVIRENIS